MNDTTYCPHCASELTDPDEILAGLHFDCEQNEIDNRREEADRADARCRDQA